MVASRSKVRSELQKIQEKTQREYFKGSDKNQQLPRATVTKIADSLATPSTSCNIVRRKAKKKAKAETVDIALGRDAVKVTSPFSSFLSYTPGTTRDFPESIARIEIWTLATCGTPGIEKASCRIACISPRFPFDCYASARAFRVDELI